MEPNNSNDKARFGRLNNLISNFRRKKVLPMALFVVSFAAVGAIMLFRSFAAGNGSINGVAFQDINRNGMKDEGELPWQNHQIYLFNSTTGVNIAVKYTDASGFYSFSGLEAGDYRVAYASPSFAGLKMDWTPTTTGSYLPEKKVSLNSTVVTLNFGWRQIVRSTNPDAPIASKVYPDGLRINIYNDVIAPDTLYNSLHQGGLVGQEKATITIRLDLGTYSATGSSYAGSNGSYSGYGAIMTLDWNTWLNSGENVLFHEYGHAWAGYFLVMVQQDPYLNGYLKARGLTGDPRVDSSYGWSRHELIAEDYRQLFGGPEGRVGGQANGEVPAAKDVPGLLEYLRDTFTKPPAGGAISAPTNLAATTSLTTNGPSVQLNWTASSGSVSRYDVYRNNVKIGFVNSPTTTYYDGTNLSSSTSYSYYVKAVDSAGTNSAASNTVTVTTPASDTTKPTAPANLTSPSQTKNSISLQWMAGTDNVVVSEYRIYQDSRKLQPILKGTALGTTFTVSGLKANTSYTFYVTTVDAAGNESLPSNVISVKTKR